MYHILACIGLQQGTMKTRAIFRGTLWAIASAMLLADVAKADEYTVAEGNASMMVAIGCFWCVEQAFEQYAPGVVEAVSGYAGGTSDNPSKSGKVTCVQEKE